MILDEEESVMDVGVNESISFIMIPYVALLLPN